MSVPRYERYKASGIEWLGNVPEHWSVVPLKRVGRLKAGAGFPHEAQGVQGEEISFHKVNAIAQAAADGFLLPSENTVSRETAARLGAFIFPPGTIVFAKIGAALLLGRIRLLREPSCIDNNMMGLITDQPNCVGFLRYLMHLVKFDLIVNPGAVPSLSEGQVAEFRISVPPIVEQLAIAAFLDRETAKIDALVDEQRRLIELLEEKRQAVISHTVTKGLDPNAPLKDSGVEWLGQVPEHWEVCALKRLCTTITDGAHISPETENGVFCFVSTKDLVGEGIDFDGCLRTSEASYEYLVRTGCQPRRGDVLFSKDGTVGRTVVVHEDREFVVASSLIIIRPDQRLLNAAFLHKLCQSHLVGNQVESYVKGAGLPRLSIQNLLKVVGVFPPIPEQLAIAAFLDQETAKIDELAQAAERGIALLQERCTALISAAVTGKIDVRGAAPAAAEAA